MTYSGCLSCASPRIEYVEHHGPTGVAAPDGGEEWRTESGVQCRWCGAIEDRAGEYGVLTSWRDIAKRLLGNWGRLDTWVTRRMWRRERKGEYDSWEREVTYRLMAWRMDPRPIADGWLYDFLWFVFRSGDRGGWFHRTALSWLLILYPDDVTLSFPTQVCLRCGAREES
jgi:hypothetical protein